MQQDNPEPIAVKDRYICFDMLKIIASFTVVMLHVSAQHWFYVKLKTPEWRAFNLYDGSVRFSVPLFVMISGALFLSKDRPIGKLYGKYILRIVTAFLFWSILYAAISFYRGTPLIDVIKEAIKGHYHLWYLYMIVGLYMIVPLLRPVVQNKKLLHCFLVLSFLVGIVVPQSIAILTVFRAIRGVPHSRRSVSVRSADGMACRSDFRRGVNLRHIRKNYRPEAHFPAVLFCSGAVSN